jgi:hypothetical protein
MRLSRLQFTEVVWPEIQPLAIWGEEPEELVPIELVDERLAERLDRQGGADYAISYSMGLEFVASRVCGVNRDGHSYNEFTVRDAIPGGYPTEMDKRCRAALDGRLILRWVVQANVIGQQLTWACVADARQFYEWICPMREQLEARQTTNARFLKVPPAALEGVRYEEVIR